MDIGRAKFGETMRELREGRGLSLAQAGKQFGWSAMRIQRQETAEARPQPEMVAALLELYEVPEPLRSELHQAAVDLSLDGWWRKHKHAAEGQTAHAELEAAARQISVFSGPVVPGLLQTEEYAKVRIRSARWPRWSKGTPDASLALRLERRKILGKVDLEVILDEAFLRRVSCPPLVMREQLRHLTSELPRVTVRVLPFDRVLDDFLLLANTFSIYRLASEQVVLTDTSVLGPQLVPDEVEVAAYGYIFDRLRDAALDPEESRRMIVAAAKEY